MFHTYVLAASGRVVDFDRASFLMDKQLLASATKAMREERMIRPCRDADADTTSHFYEELTRPRDASDWAQWLWGEYCELHFEKYGEYFVPDVNPAWDS